MDDATPMPGRSDRWATLMLTALATGAAGLAIAEPGQDPGRSLLRAWGLLAAVCLVAPGAGRWVARSGVGRGIAPAAVPLAALALPFAIAGARLAAGSGADPLEILLLAALRNLGVVLALMGDRARSARPAAVVSLFLILVSSCVAEGTFVVILLAAYAVVGGAWLAASHWRGLSLPTPLASARAGVGRPPLAALALAVGLVLVVSGLVAVGPARAASALAGLVPSSGGTLWDDPDARGGVGDGENEVKGSEKPESIGFTDSDVYLESDRPALYDAFNDMYGEPVRPKKQERMVSIANDKVQEQKEQAAENLRAGRQFAAVRKRPMAAGRKPGGREAKALVYVKGPAPLHLALAAYDRFDGRDWDEEPACARSFPFVVEKDGADPWFRRRRVTPSHLGGEVRHQIKVGTLDSGPMPLPAHLDRFRVGRVDRPDFFGWAQDGVVGMAGRTVPAGTVIETESRRVDPRRLREIVFPQADAAPARAAGYRPDPAVRRLALAWAGDLPRGWGQVEAVVGKVRQHAAHDRGEVLPPDCDDAVAHFLLRSRRGPDFLFASAAIALLRELGYPARMVTGLYADPARYDPRTHHVPVTGDDVHAWAEVRLPDGEWAAIEPTPGYAVPLPDPSWAERLAEAMASASRWARAHPSGLLAGLVAVLILGWKRREIADALDASAWHLATMLDPGRGAVLALRLIDGRCRRAGCPRPPGRTPRRWYGRFAGGPGIDGEGDLARLVALAERQLYAPLHLPPSSEQLATCRRVVGGWTSRRFRAIARTLTPNEALA